MAPIDFPMVLALALPGLAVWAIGQAFVLVRARSGNTSSIGLRLSFVGLGLFSLLPTLALVVDAVAVGLWILAVILIALIGWWPIAFFWLATRPRVTKDDPRPPAT